MVLSAWRGSLGWTTCGAWWWIQRSRRVSDWWWSHGCLNRQAGEFEGFGRMGGWCGWLSGHSSLFLTKTGLTMTIKTTASGHPGSKPQFFNRRQSEPLFLWRWQSQIFKAHAFARHSATSKCTVTRKTFLFSAIHQQLCVFAVILMDSGWLLLKLFVNIGKWSFA